MPRLPIAAVMFAAAIWAGPALAGPKCNVPLAEWQPRAALQQKVEAEGWRVTRIRTKDGCYKVDARNDQGEHYEATFDPATLRMLKMEIERD